MWFGSNAVNLIENARSSHEFHECHETLSLSVALFLALFVYFVQFVAVLVLPKQEFHLKLMALGRIMLILEIVGFMLHAASQFGA
jgi:hypothetical protein